MVPISQDDLDRIENWIYEGQGDDGESSRYPSMTYEQGMRDLLDILRGEITVDEFINEQ